MPVNRRAWCLPWTLGLSVGLFAGGMLGAVWGLGAPKTLFAQTKKDALPECESLGEFSSALKLLENKYIRPLERKALLEAAIEGMTSILDPHTTYLSPKEAKLLREEIDGAFGGVGLVVHWEPQWLDAEGKEKSEPPETPELAAKTPYRIRLRVKTVVPNSPAAAAKLKAGDAIVEIEGKAVSQFAHLGAAVMKMRGPIGTPVRFRAQREGREFEVKVKRGRVLSTPLVVRELGDGVLYVQLQEFSAGVADGLRRALTRNEGKGRKLVLDLRDNGGGLLAEAVAAADLFVSKGILVRTRGRGQREIEQRRAHRAGTLRDLPVVVLINKASASASEILAGALQDHGRALVVGERSFGKGSVQIPYGLGDGSMLKTTVALYYTPKDRVIQARGITPDLWVSAQPTPFEDSRPGVQSERDTVRHLVPDGGEQGGVQARTRAQELKGEQVPAQRPSLRASAQDPQLRAAVEYLLAADRLGRD